MNLSKAFIVLSSFFILGSCSSVKNNDRKAVTALSEKATNETETKEKTREMTKVLLKTSKGDIIIALYNETPLHRDNFIKLVNEKFYDGVLFHRIIQGFMIQTGDPSSKNASPSMALGQGGPGYTIPAEFVPELYHKRGAVAAARLGDQVNPKKESSGSQFYIVDGAIFPYERVSMMRKGDGREFTQSQKEAYSSIGGAPHLDGAYTVFGEVLSGMDIVDKIAAMPKDNRDRPKEDISIIEATIIE